MDSPGTLYFTQNPSALQSHVYPGIATEVPPLSSKIFLELSTNFTIMTQGLLTMDTLPVPLKMSSERDSFHVSLSKPAPFPRALSFAMPTYSGALHTHSCPGGAVVWALGYENPCS